MEIHTTTFLKRLKISQAKGKQALNHGYTNHQALPASWSAPVRGRVANASSTFASPVTGAYKASESDACAVGRGAATVRSGKALVTATLALALIRTRIDWAAKQQEYLTCNHTYFNSRGNVVQTNQAADIFSQYFSILDAVVHSLTNFLTQNTSRSKFSVKRIF